MKPAPRPDFLMALAVLALVAAGLTFVLSASSMLSTARYGNEVHFLVRQALFALVGGLAMAWALRLDPRALRRALGPALAVVLALLAAVLVPGLGHKVGGARRWLGVSALRFQPSELFKIVAVLFAAERLARNLESGGSWREVLPSLAPLGLGLALVYLEPDFGSTALAVLVLAGLLFAAGVPARVLALSGACLAPVGALLMLHKAYRRRRLEVFLHPWRHASSGGFQITHSLMAFGTGGPLGVGLGKGRQKLFYLPEPHTDFIFATVGEEVGLVGCLIVLFFFWLLLWRGMLVALKARDLFVKLAGLGLTLSLGLQVLVNLFVVLGIAPTKGTTLPFLSSGGSALVMDMAAVGFLMNFSKQVDAERLSGAAR